MTVTYSEHTDLSTTSKQTLEQRISEHISEALGVFSDKPGDVFELTVLEKNRAREFTRKGYFNNLSALAAEAARQTQRSSSKAIYVNGQEIDPECIHRAENKMLDGVKAVSAADVVRYRRFVVDIDREGIKDISATDEEKTALRQTLDAIHEFLVHDLKWPDPRSKVDTGNGFHDAWMLDLPVTKENQALIAQCYKALNQRFGSDTMKVDGSLADPNQLIKLPGTKARKGDNTAKRPHRFAKLLATFETEPVTIEQLQALAALYKPEVKDRPAHQRTITWQADTPENVESWAKHHEIKLGQREPYEGGHKWRTNCLTSTEHADGAALILNGGGYLNFKCHHASCAEKSISDVLKKYAPVIHQNGAGHTHQAAQSDIFSDLAAFEGDAQAVTTWILDRLSDLSALERGQFLKLSVVLQERGVSSDWIRRELKPAVREAQNARRKGVTWRDYVDAANDLGYEFRLNVLNDTVEVNGERLSDVIEARLLSYLHAKGLPNADIARRAFTTDAAERPFHPVKNFLESITWDGADHIAGLSRYFDDAHDLITYSHGGKRTVIHAWLYRWLIGAVAKVYEPANAQNPMLILDGAQGRGKSYFVKWLCALSMLHFEGAIRPEDKDYLAYLTTRWIWEVSELGATMRKADREALKAFITLQHVTYRAAYGHHALHKPALASFIGTVNFEGSLLADPTGHRRFWPVEIVALDWKYAENIDVHQVWAQAYALYRKGEAWQLSPEEREMHARITETYQVEDVLEGYLRELFIIDPKNNELYTHTTKIIRELRKPAGVQEPPRISGSDTAVAMRLATTLHSLKLKKEKRRVDGEQGWGYVGIALRT